MTSPDPETVLVSMGSNIEPRSNMLRAVQALHAKVDVVAVSRLFDTQPVTQEHVPGFLNAAVEISTELEPEALKFEVLRAIETELGRVRTRDRDAPRQIDLDIALFGDRVVRDEGAGLRIPDPDIVRCAHVASPLADLAPRRRHPVDGRTLAEIADDLADQVGVRLADNPDDLIERLDRMRRKRLLDGSD